MAAAASSETANAASIAERPLPNPEPAGSPTDQPKQLTDPFCSSFL